MSRKKYILVVFLSLCMVNVKAQTWEIGASAGGAGYIGDLNINNPLKVSGIQGGLFVKKNFDPYFGLSANYNYGQIKGDDATSKYPQLRERNLNFKTSLNEFSLIFDFNFLAYFSGGGPKKFSPYLFVGGGVLFYNPTTTYQGKKLDLRDYTTEGPDNAYKKYTIAIPYGVGMRYNLRESLSIFSQLGYRYTNTDYLDDVSGLYPDKNVFENLASGQVSKALTDRSGEKNGVFIGDKGTQRGDLRIRDTYMFVSIGISYTFVSSKCY